MCEGCLAVLVVWCGDSAGSHKSKVATSLAYIKNRLKPNLRSMDATKITILRNEGQHVRSPASRGWTREQRSTLIYAHDAQTRRRTSWRRTSWLKVPRTWRRASRLQAPPAPRPAERSSRRRTSAGQDGPPPVPDRRGPDLRARAAAIAPCGHGCDDARRRVRMGSALWQRRKRNRTARAARVAYPEKTPPGNYWASYL